MAAVATVLLGGCTSQVREQDAQEFNYPAIRKARAKLREGDKQAALELLNKAIDEKPRLAQAHLEVAQLYNDYDHNYVRAIYHFERYLELRQQTEKREMIEGLIRKASIAFAASVAEQVPGLDKRAQALQEENDRLKQDLQQVRENLAMRIAASQSASARAGVPVTPLERVSGRGGKSASDVTMPEAPVAGPAMDVAAAAKPSAGKPWSPTAPPEAGKPSGTQYRVQRGDTLSKVAARMYQNPRQWKVIYDANRDTLGGSEKLKVGQVLIIPK